MTESCLRSLTSEKNTKKETGITPLFKSLIGVTDLPANFDYKREYRDYISEKSQYESCS